MHFLASYNFFSWVISAYAGSVQIETMEN